MVEVPFPEPGYFFSYLDEENFFEWLLRIPVVSRIGDRDTELSIVLRTAKIDDQSAEEFVALAARYGLDTELPASMRKGRAVPRKKKAGPESVILTEAPSKGFSLSLRPVFLSPLDERGFNDWLKAIHPRYTGLDERKTAVLDLKSAEVDRVNVWSLIAICRCYRLNLARLRRLCEVADRDFFDDKKWRWHKQIFGASSSS
jgi:hypothetical protein